MDSTENKPPEDSILFIWFSSALLHYRDALHGIFCHSCSDFKKHACFEDACYIDIIFIFTWIVHIVQIIIDADCAISYPQASRSLKPTVFKILTSANEGAKYCGKVKIYL